MFSELINLEATLATLLSFAPKLVTAVLVWAAFWLLHKITHTSIRNILRKRKIDPHLTTILVDNIYRVAILGVGLVMAASQLGIDVGAALAGIGVVGIAIGFAAQDTLSNIIAGFMIFWDKPFQVGDWISVKGEYGKVTDITVRSTRIRTVQNTYVIIPNKIMADELVNNHTKNGETRVDVIVGIAYKEYIPDARAVLLRAISAIDGVLETPEPEVVVKEIADSSINLLVKVWIEDAALELPIFYAVSEACKLSLDEAGIEIPFPHMQLFVDDVKSKIWKDAMQTMKV